MFTQNDFRALKRLIEKLNKAKEEHVVLIVEGKKDAAALKPLVHADFFLLSRSRGSLFESAERIALRYKRAILLLDADRKGRQLTKTMKEYLQKNGVRVDTAIGQRLLKLTGCRNVEGLKKNELVKAAYEQ